MEGYLNDPEKPKNAFINIDNKSYYRTGDLFHKDPKGVYYILGRVDSIVKVKGYRINTSTITNILTEESFVVEAITIVVDWDKIEKEIVSFVTLNSPFHNFESILSEKCKAQLPLYMVPSRFYKIEKFPYGKTGKHDVKVLKNLAVELLGKR